MPNRQLKSRTAGRPANTLQPSNRYKQLMSTYKCQIKWKPTKCKLIVYSLYKCKILCQTMHSKHIY